MENKEQFVQDLSTILIRHKIFSQSEAAVMQKTFQKASQEAFDDFLLDEGLIDKEDLLKAIGEYYQIPAIDLSGYFFQTFLLKKFPKDVMLRNFFIPLEIEQNMLVVVAGEPDDQELLSIIGKYVSYDVQFRVSIKQDIRDSIVEFYDKSDTEVDAEWAATEDLGEREFEMEVEDQYASADQYSSSDEDEEY